MSRIDIDRAVVAAIGRTFVLAGDDVVKPAAGQVENGWLPNTDLACRSAWITCHGAWYAAFTRMAAAVTGTGGKLQTVANVVGSSDQTAADQFRPIPDTEPTSVHGTHGGRYYR